MYRSNWPSLGLAVTLLGSCADPFLNDLPEPLPAEDTAPPKVTFVSPAANATVSDTVRWEVTADDAQSNVASVEFRAGGLLVDTLISPPFAFDFVTTSRTDGPLTLEVIATDTSPKANKGIASINVIVANDPPDFPNLGVTPNPARASDTLTMTFTASETLIAEPTVTVANNAATLVTATGTNYEYSYAVAGNEAEGSAVVLVSGRDAVDLLGIRTTTVLLDFSDPLVEALTPSDAGTGTHVGSSFSLTAQLYDGSVGSGVATCQACAAVDGACDSEWTNAGATAGSCTATGLACSDGEVLTLGMRALDGAGNEGLATQEVRTCDAAAPVATGALTIDTTATATHVAASFNVSVGFTDVAGVGACECCRSTDGACDTEWLPATLTSGVCSAALTCAGTQTLMLNLRARDVFGSGPTAASAQTRICDTDAPIAGAVSPAAATTTHVAGAFTLQTSFTDTGSGLGSCDYCKSTDGVCDSEWLPANVAGSTCSATALTCTNGETVTLNMRAADRLGHAVTATAISRICDTSIPAAGAVTVNIDSGTHIRNPFDVSTTFSDPGPGIASCEFCLSLDGTCDTEWQTVTYAAGTCTRNGLACTNGQSLTLSMRATSNTGAVGAAAPITRTCDTANPTPGLVTPTSPPATASHLPGTFDVTTTFTDSGAGVASCDVCASLDGVCDTEWTAAGFSAGVCSALGLTCSEGPSLILNMRATDGVGHTQAAAAAVPRFCDTTAPALGALAASSGSATHVASTFTFNATLADSGGSGVLRCEACKSTDGACDTEWVAAIFAAGACTSPAQTCTGGQSLTLGLRGFDNVQNVGTVTAARACDTVAPAAGSVTAANQATPTHVSSPFDLSATFTDSGSGLATCQVCVANDGSCDPADWATASVSGSTCNAAGLACTNGQSLTLNMRGTDSVGNLTTATAITRTCDSAPPTGGTVTPANQAISTHVAASFDLATTFSDAAGLLDCQVCKATDGACDSEWVAATLTGTTCSALGLTCTNGQALALNMRARDVLGSGYGPATAVSRTCDAAPPTATGTVTPSSTDSGTHIDASFNLSTPFTDSAGLASCQVCKAVDGICDSEWVAASLGGTTCSAAGLACSDGQTLTLNMRAQDVFGNGFGDAVAVTRTCDTVAPTAGTVTPANGATATHVSGTFDVSTTFGDARSGVASCQVCKSTVGACGSSSWSDAIFAAGTCSAGALTCTNGQSVTRQHL